MYEGVDEGEAVAASNGFTWCLQLFTFQQTSTRSSIWLEWWMSKQAFVLTLIAYGAGLFPPPLSRDEDSSTYSAMQVAFSKHNCRNFCEFENPVFFPLTRRSSFPTESLSRSLLVSRWSSGRISISRRCNGRRRIVVNGRVLTEYPLPYPIIRVGPSPWIDSDVNGLGRVRSLLDEGLCIDHCGRSNVSEGNDNDDECRLLYLGGSSLYFSSSFSSFLSLGSSSTSSEVLVDGSTWACW